MTIKNIFFLAKYQDITNHSTSWICQLQDQACSSSFSRSKSSSSFSCSTSTYLSSLISRFERTMFLLCTVASFRRRSATCKHMLLFSRVFFIFVSPQFLLFVAFSGSSPPPLGCRAAPGKPTWSSARWWRYHHNHHNHHGASQWCFKLIASHCVLKPVRDNLVVHTIGL